MIKPITEKMSTRYTNIKSVYVDLDGSRDLAMKYSVNAMPIYILFKNGKNFKTAVGANPDLLEEIVESLTAKIIP